MHMFTYARATTYTTDGLADGWMTWGWIVQVRVYLCLCLECVVVNAVMLSVVTRIWVSYAIIYLHINMQLLCRLSAIYSSIL